MFNAIDTIEEEGKSVRRMSGGDGGFKGIVLVILGINFDEVSGCQDKAMCYDLLFTAATKEFKYSNRARNREHATVRVKSVRYVYMYFFIILVILCFMIPEQQKMTPW
jgi:hypothetical protein